MNILKIATLNLNGIYTPNMIAMLHAILRSHVLDILFLQEITHPNFGNLPGYTTYTNVGTTMRGTAFVTRNDLQVTNITKLPTGRGIPVECDGITLLNYMNLPGQQNRRREKPFLTLTLYTLCTMPQNT